MIDSVPIMTNVAINTMLREESDEEVIGKGFSEETAPILASPFCRELRSKNYFMLDRLPVDATDYLDESNHCWCENTQMVFGPDGGIADPEHCVPGRSCYRSAFENPS